MDVQEIIEKRIQRVRLNTWFSDAYVKIHFLEDGTYSPWVYLVSPRTQKALGLEVGQQILFVEAFGEEDWQEYKGVPVYGF